MGLIQISHFKLWLAGNLRNWPLAEYELSQMKATLQDAKILFPNVPAADTSAISQSAEEFRDQNKRWKNRPPRGQNTRLEGSREHNPLKRFYELNGPDVRVRGPAAIIAEKYLQLAGDAQASGDLIAAEGYLQHAEHYNRLITAAQEQFRQ